MGNLTGDVMISGRIARLIYVSFYRLHLLALHGFLRTVLLVLTQWLAGTDKQSTSIRILPYPIIYSGGYSYATRSFQGANRHLCRCKSLKSDAVSQDSCFREAGVGGSNPLTPTNHFFKRAHPGKIPARIR